MIITQKPACSIIAGDILVYDFYMESGERKTAEVISSSTNEKDTTITYIDNVGMFAGKPFTFPYQSDELLNCVDIEAEARALVEEMESKPEYDMYSGICRGCETALAGAETEEMESRESWIEARRKEQS